MQLKKVTQDSILCGFSAEMSPYEFTNRVTNLSCLEVRLNYCNITNYCVVVDLKFASHCFWTFPSVINQAQCNCIGMANPEQCLPILWECCSETSSNSGWHPKSRSTALWHISVGPGGCYGWRGHTRWWVLTHFKRVPWITWLLVIQWQIYSLVSLHYIDFGCVCSNS